MAFPHDFRMRLLPPNLRRLVTGERTNQGPGAMVGQRFHKTWLLRRCLPTVREIHWRRVGRQLQVVNVVIWSDGAALLLPGELFTPSIPSDGEVQPSLALTRCSRTLRTSVRSLQQAALLIKECSQLFPTHDRITLV